MDFSPEMTFLPMAYPHCLSRRRGEALVERVNQWLASFGTETGLHLHAKLDPYRLNPKTGRITGWCVEVIPLVTPFRSSWLDKASINHPGFMAGIDHLFEVLRDVFNLVPSVTKRRGGRERHLASGGCHVHVGADLFTLSSNWYSTMERFHRNLVMDYANRPYIRWLLAQWSDDLNSKCLVTEEDYASRGRRPDVREVWNRALFKTHAIEPRYMSTSKASYLTFEFRFVNMVESAAELRDVATILICWMKHIAALTTAGRTVRLKIKRADLLSYRDLGSAHSIVNSWLDSIAKHASLCDQVRPTVQTLFLRNYRNRVLYGKMV